MTEQATKTLTTLEELADYFIWVANDVGSYLSNLKLNKLLYYAQAWHLALHDTPLFDEDFEAWVHGPVIPSLFYQYKEQFEFRPLLKEVVKPKFSQELHDFLEDILDVFFMCDSYELEKMTRMEDPWVNARKGLPRDEHSNAIISKESMREYYKSRAA